MPARKDFESREETARRQAEIDRAVRQGNSPEEIAERARDQAERQHEIDEAIRRSKPEAA